MDDVTQDRSDIGRGWRGALVRMAVVLVAWSVLRSVAASIGIVPDGRHGSTAWSLGILLALVVTASVPWRRERRHQRARHLGVAAWLPGGLLAGIVLMSAVFGTLLLADWYEFVRVDARMTTLLVHAGTWLLVAAHEELLFRRVVLRGIEPLLGSIGAIAVTALAFAAAHVDGSVVDRGDAVLLALGGGMLFGACAVASGGLWLPIGVHAGWNLAQSALFGLPAPGFRLEPVVTIGTITGPPHLAGQTGSVESGLVAALLAAGAAAAVLLLGRSRIRPGAWATRLALDPDVEAGR